MSRSIKIVETEVPIQPFDYDVVSVLKGMVSEDDISAFSSSDENNFFMRTEQGLLFRHDRNSGQTHKIPYQSSWDNYFWKALEYDGKLMGSRRTGQLEVFKHDGKLVNYLQGDVVITTLMIYQNSLVFSTTFRMEFRLVHMI